MERENLMQRLTSSVKSFLVPSFVSNVLSPRREESQPSGVSGRIEQSGGVSQLMSGRQQRQQQHQQQAHTASEDAPGSRTIDIASVDRPNSSAVGGGSASVLWTSVDRGKRHLEAASAAGGGSKRLKVSPCNSSSSSKQSLFYPGRVAYGGSYNSQQQQSVRATPLMWDQRRVQRSQREPLAGSTGVGDNRLVTPTAKKILDALDRLSTPLSDARRIPPAPDSCGQQQMRAVQYSPYRVAYRRRQAQVPNRSMGVVRQQQQQRRPADSPSALANAPSLTGGLVKDLTAVAVAATAVTKPQEQPATPHFEFSAPIQRGPRHHSPAVAPPRFTFSRPEPAVAPPPKLPSASLGADASFVPKLKAPTTVDIPQVSGGSFKDALKAMTSAGESNNEGEKWRCGTCSCVSPASANSCVVCQTERPATSQKVAATTPAIATKKVTEHGGSDEWRCDTCSCVSPASAQACVVCQTKRSTTSATPTSAATSLAASTTASASADGEQWRCETCSCVSPASAQACVVCQTKRSTASATPTSAATTATPESGTLPKRPSFLDKGPATTPIFSMFSQQKKRQCDRCQAEIDVSGSCATCDTSASATPAKWQCSTCLVENVSSVSRCVCCDSAKPGAVPKAPGTSTSVDKTPNVAFGASNADPAAPKVSFGVPASTHSGTLPKISFGAPASTKETPKSEEKTAASSKVSFGFGSSDTAASTPGVSGFKFGAPSVANSGQSGLSSFKFGDSSGTSSTNLKVAFGSSSVESSAAPGSSFSVPSATGQEKSKVAFGAPVSTESSGPKLSFGAPAAISSDPAGSNSNFSVPGTAVSGAAAPKFGAPSSTESSSPKTSFGAPTSTTSVSSAPKLNFGTTSSESSVPKLSFGATAAISSESSAPKLSFGTSTNSESLKPKLSLGVPPGAADAESSAPKLVFGGATVSNSASSTPTLNFGTSAAAVSSAAPSPNFGAPTVTNSGTSTPSLNFGAPSSAAPKSMFGTSDSTQPPPPPSFNFTAFSAPASSSTFMFGAAAGEQQASATTSLFSASVPATGGFTFGGSQLKRPAEQQQQQSQAPQAKLPSTGLFGGPTTFSSANNNAVRDTAPQVDLDANKAPSFNFGGDQATGSTPFVFGGNRPQQQQPALNGSAVQDANPFTPGVRSGGSSSRPRLMGRRRIPR